MHVLPPIQCYALYHNIQQGVYPLGYLFLMIRSSSEYMSGGLVNSERKTSITSNFIYLMRFEIFIKKKFQVGQSSS